MHTLYQRVNSITALLSTCLLCLLAAVSISSYFIQVPPSEGVLDAKNLQVVWGKSRSRFPDQEWAFLRFDLKTDLRPLFHWNTKQVIVNLVAEYSSGKGVKNEVVVWDRIVRRREDARINIEDGRNTYTFRDVSRSFRNATAASFALKYNVMPYVGLLTYGEAARTPELVDFPEMRKAVY